MKVQCEVVPGGVGMAGRTVVVLLDEQDAELVIRLDPAWDLAGIGKALSGALSELLSGSFIYVGDVRQGVDGPVS